jgi:hypothetical protein
MASMFVKASVELTLASSSFSRSVTGLVPEGPGSRPEIACSAVARAAGVGAGKEAGGADESAACPLVPICPQTRLTLISRNQSELFLRLNFHEPVLSGSSLFNATSSLNCIFKIRIDVPEFLNLVLERLGNSASTILSGDVALPTTVIES